LSVAFPRTSSNPRLPGSIRTNDSSSKAQISKPRIGKTTSKKMIQATIAPPVLAPECYLAQNLPRPFTPRARHQEAREACDKPVRRRISIKVG